MCCKRSHRNSVARALLGALLLCAAAATQGQVEIRAPWVRGTVPGQTATGAFMELKSEKGASIVGADSPLAGSVEIHETRMEGGVMKMRPVPRLELPSGKTVELKPGGDYHVMLLGIKRLLKKGDVVPIRLKIQSAGEPVKTVEIRAEVRELTAAAGH